MKNLNMVVFLLILFSCNKKDDIVQTFISDLPIVKTNTPTHISVGHNITSNVHCELGSLSGSVYFQGFEIKTPADKHFNISAYALFKDWNTQIGSPVMWTLDTALIIKTTTEGKYILNFYNADNLFKSDTVQVK